MMVFLQVNCIYLFHQRRNSEPDAHMKHLHHPVNLMVLLLGCIYRWFSTHTLKVQIPHKVLHQRSGRFLHCELRRSDTPTGFGKNYSDLEWSYCPIQEVAGHAVWQVMLWRDSGGNASHSFVLWHEARQCICSTSCQTTGADGLMSDTVDLWSTSFNPDTPLNLHLWSSFLLFRLVSDFSFPRPLKASHLTLCTSSSGLTIVLQWFGWTLTIAVLKPGNRTGCGQSSQILHLVIELSSSCRNPSWTSYCRVYCSLKHM